jgi:transcriptional regulator NrdR family protein
VINDSRSKGDYIQRRRECANGHKFNTEERAVPDKKRGRPVKIKEKVNA